VSLSSKSFDGYQAYYQRMLNILAERTDAYYEVALFEWFVINQFTLYDVGSEGGIDIDMSISYSTIKETELYFYKLLVQAAVVTDLDKYETDFDAYRNSIQWSIRTVLNRDPTDAEVQDVYIKNALGLWSVDDVRFTNFFTWLHILYFGQESRTNGGDMPWANAFRPLKTILPLTFPKFALLLSGHSRDFMAQYTSHKVFVNNPYIDIFIHTWTKKGPRYEYEQAECNAALLSSLYQPKRMLVEDENPLKNTFSLRDRFRPLFLTWEQQGDDASRYVNSKLYSLWKALTLMETYEAENSLSYDGIIKLNFNLSVTTFDFRGIIQDIGQNVFGITKNAMYCPPNPYPMAAKAGGCWKCDKEVGYAGFNFTPRHANHLNDVSTYTFYANRTIGKKACELYLSAVEIYQNHHSTNLTNINNVPHTVKAIHGNFIYIRLPDIFHGKVIDENHISKKIFCYYPEVLMREHMAANVCLTTSNIIGTFTNFDVFSQKP